jgi:hypothetical protein
MLNRRQLILTGLGLVAATRSAAAHHSTAMYDMANPKTIKGAVKRFEWTNPHAFLFIEVKDDKGTVTEWEVEMMSLNHLRTYGWARNTVKAGDIVGATGAPAKNGDPSMIAGVVELPDGRKIRS